MKCLGIEDFRFGQLVQLTNKQNHIAANRTVPSYEKEKGILYV